ncbi:MAG: hypothetical protein V3R70_08460, partial [Syntrophobacteria bacterium]
PFDNKLLEIPSPIAFDPLTLKYRAISFYHSWGRSPSPGTPLRGPSDGDLGGFEPEIPFPRNSSRHPDFAPSVPAAIQLQLTPANPNRAGG